MAKKDTKRYLNQLRTYQFIIDHKLAELYRLETMATKTTVALQGDRVQTSPSDKLSEAMAKIVDLKDEIAEGYNEYIEKRRVIMGQIESLEDDEYKKVLILRYDECLPFLASLEL
jgi:hypothetical protein